MDFDTFSEVHPGNICWYLYDSVHDGIDLAVRAYPRVAELLEKALDRLQSCTCSDEEGCFRCIRNPDEEQPVGKGDCIQVLELLCAEFHAESTQEEFDADPLEDDSTSRKCPTCGKTAGDAARFCDNCGDPLGDVVP